MSNSLNKEDYLGWEDQELYNQWWNEAEARRRETTYVELRNTPIPDTKAKPVYDKQLKKTNIFKCWMNLTTI